MNKYQEAYQRLTNRIYKNDHIEDVYKDLEVVGELVDKATPKKPIIKCVLGYYECVCPTCNNSAVIYLNHCECCGQKLDWSKVEVNCDEE